jgi:hypothetical protein
MAHNHHLTTSHLDPLMTAVELLTDHGYDVTTATLSADGAPDSEQRATITLELAAPGATERPSASASLGTPETDSDAATGSVDGDSDSNPDAAATRTRGDGGGLTLGSAAPLQRPADSDGPDAGETTSDESSSSATDAASEAPSDQYWCGKCGYGPGTKRAIGIHDGHKHDSDAEYVSTEPAPEDLTEPQTTHRTPEELDAIVERFLANPSTAEGDAAEQSAGGDPETDPAEDEGADADPGAVDGQNGDETNAPSSSADAEDLPAELPDLGFPIPERITVEAVRRAVEEADDLADVQESLKWPPGQCRILLEEMDLGTELLGVAPKTGYSRRPRWTA